jgi:NADH:ubiquinone oxidoreductase subunit 2 (subunit N)
MNIETVLFKEIVIFSELFLGISIIYLVLHCTFLSVQKKYPLIQASVLQLSVLVLFFSSYLVFNEHLSVLESSYLNNTFVMDYVSVSSKIIIGSLSIFCLLMMQPYVLNQKINNFEYFLLILFSILGLFLLCSSNDFLTAYLALELQSLSFYVLAAFKKNSTFSVDAGIKYFILGAFASSMFLFGSSLLYGVTGTVCFDDFNSLFISVLPGQSNIITTSDYIASVSECVKVVEELGLVSYVEPTLQSVLPGQSNIITTSDYIASVSECVKVVEELGLVSYVEPTLQNLDVMVSAFDQALTHSTAGSSVSSVLECVQIVEELGLVGYTEPTLQNSDFMVSALDLALMNNTFSVGSLLGDSTVFDGNLIKFALVFIMIGLFFKLTIAPFHVWAPDVYEGSPTSSTFFFSVVPKLAIFVLLLRIFYYSFYGFIDSWRYFIVLVVVFSIIVGSFGGLEQRKLKTLLVYSTISHMGYSLIAFSAGTFESMQMLLSYLIVYSFSGLCVWSIFLATRLKNNYFQKQNKDLTDLVLLGKSNYMLAIFFTTVLFSVAGFPPMIGFLVKMGIFVTAIESSMYFVALISILCSVVGTFYYIRIIKILYFEKVLVGKLYYPINSQSSVIITSLFFLLIFLFINPTLLFLISYKFSLLVFL